MFSDPFKFPPCKKSRAQPRGLLSSAVRCRIHELTYNVRFRLVSMNMIKQEKKNHYLMTSYNAQHSKALHLTHPEGAVGRQFKAPGSTF